MENASKALLIVAGVFLGIMLLSVMIYVFRQGASVNKSYDEKQINLQLELYNSQFENYDRNNNNIMDVLSLCNLAFDVNKDSEFDDALSVQIEVLIGGLVFKLPNTNQINERNQILVGTSTTPKSIYSLVNSNLKDLTITSVAQKKDLFSNLPSEERVSVSIDLENDKLSTTKLKSGRTIYKYLFAVVNENDFDYHPANMKVSKIRLTAYCNPEWKD